MSPPPLPGVLAALAPVLDHYGYWAIAGLVTLEDFGAPVPGETVLIVGAIYAGAGRLNIVAVAMVGFLAAVVGDNIGYLIGRAGGRRLADRFGRYVLLTPQRLDKAEEFFARYGGWVVIIARFVEGLRQANGIIAGITKMRWPTFLAFNALGAALWVGLWVSIGTVAGAHIDTIYPLVVRYELYLGIAIGLLIAAIIIRALLHRRRRGRNDGRPRDAEVRRSSDVPEDRRQDRGPRP